jgi:predicted RNase H-like HicB family nuclease
MHFTVEVERETDKRWIAEVKEFPGVMVYAATRKQAISKAQALALRILADCIEHSVEMLDRGVP